LNSKQRTLLFAVILAAPVFAFADNIPGHSRDRNNYVSFSEGLTDQQDSHSNSARCNFLLSSVKEPVKGNESRISSTAGASFSGFAKGESVNLGGFGANQGASSDKDEGKGQGKQRGGASDGNGSGSGSESGSGVPSPAVSVAEPGSQTLLLFGLAGLGMLFYRRKTLTNAI
jgi:hypothetical protein